MSQNILFFVLILNEKPVFIFGDESVTSYSVRAGHNQPVEPQSGRPFFVEGVYHNQRLPERSIK